MKEKALAPRKASRVDFGPPASLQNQGFQVMRQRSVQDQTRKISTGGDDVSKRHVPFGVHWWARNGGDIDRDGGPRRRGEQLTHLSRQGRMALSFLLLDYRLRCTTKRKVVAVAVGGDHLLDVL